MAFDVTRAVNDAIAKNKVSFNLDENFDDTQMRAFVSNLITAFFDELKNLFPTLQIFLIFFLLIP